MSDNDCGCCTPKICPCNTCSTTGMTEQVGSWSSDDCVLTSSGAGSMLLFWSGSILSKCNNINRFQISVGGAWITQYANTTNFNYTVLTETGWEFWQVVSGTHTLRTKNECMELGSGLHTVTHCTYLVGSWGHDEWFIDDKIAADSINTSVAVLGSGPRGFYDKSGSAQFFVGDGTQPCPGCLSTPCTPRDILDRGHGLVVDFSESTGGNDLCECCDAFLGNTFTLDLIGPGYGWWYNTVFYQYCQYNPCTISKDDICERGCVSISGDSGGGHQPDPCEQDHLDAPTVIQINAVLDTFGGHCRWALSFSFSTCCNIPQCYPQPRPGHPEDFPINCIGSDSKSGSGLGDPCDPACGQLSVGYASDPNCLHRCDEGTWTLVKLPGGHSCDGMCSGVTYPDKITISLTESGGESDCDHTETQSNVWYGWGRCNAAAGKYTTGDHGLTIGDTYYHYDDQHCWTLTDKLTEQPSNFVALTLGPKRTGCSDTSEPSCKPEACCTSDIDYIDICFADFIEGEYDHAFGAICSPACISLNGCYRVFEQNDDGGGDGNGGGIIQDISMSCRTPGQDYGDCNCGEDHTCGGGGIFGECRIKQVEVEWIIKRITLATGPSCWLYSTVAVRDATGQTYGSATYKGSLILEEPPFDCETGNTYTLEFDHATGVMTPGVEDGCIPPLTCYATITNA